MAAEKRPLSPSSVTLFLLFWQQPTDRALYGWSPFDFIPQDKEAWLAESLRMTLDEYKCYLRVHG